MANAQSSHITFGDSSHSVQVGVNNGPIHMTTARSVTPVEPSSNVPFRRDPDFVARAEVTAQIASALAAPAARLALVGLGGVGKSQIAIEYCHHVRQTSPDTWVLWIHASNAGRYEQSVRDVAELVRIPGRSEPKADMPTLFRNWLRERATRKWLIVLDNADEVDFLVERTDRKASLLELLPVHDQGAVLITSRSMSAAARLVERSAIVPVMPMNKEQATALLEKKLGRGKDNRALAAALDYMPLAMTQAAAYIQQRGMRSSIAKYLEKLQKSDRLKKSVLDEDAGDLRRDPEAKNAIILTWQISFEHIRKVRHSAADLLSLMCFCDRQAIPSVLLQVSDKDERRDSIARERADDGESTSGSGSEDSSQAEEEFDKDVAILEGFAFVSSTIDSSTFEMHRLVQLATRRWLDSQGEADHWKKVFARSLDDAFPSGAYENWEMCQKLLPHAIAAMSLKMKDRNALLHKASICNRGGLYMREQGLFSRSEEMCECSNNIRQDILGEEDPSTLTSMANLAATYRNQGRWGEAEQLEVRVMETRTRERWSEAEQLQVRVMETRTTVLGPEHPDTLTSTANLAGTYREEGKWGEAEKLEVQLMDKGANVKAQEGEYANALHAASSSGHAEEGHHGNALHAASAEGHAEVVRLLVDKGADVHAQGGRYGTALQAALQKDHVEVVGLLLEKDAEVSLEGDTEWITDDEDEDKEDESIIASRAYQG
ncbi:uncharacterized protein K489DRAFT_390952 [Dissoconium aciculare CBS 342.82]|uniref:NB-ARC domain-containing protein n=1 Tax=Dissoconium aciculare CBS 342.82 TaxID=1314786 RepID=A0A6J3LT15_9PEZI|nr:uncharacterized protein K489DRAFT_390952 [Dissoconium aciculare CBS 342.82]KAF1818788.1 hypothetical protein K489DRAFT_390952 [Dissoconium aciculare CBS 342.82]